MKKKAIIFLSLLLIGTVIVLAYNRLTGIKKQGGHIEATGIIEATEVNIAPKISEKIEWLCCREGDLVKLGDILIRLDKSEFNARLNEGKAGLLGAEAGYQAAQANLENAGARIEGAKAALKAAESEVDRSKALFQEAKDHFQRVSGLFAQGYAAKKDSDAAKAAYDSTHAQLQSAVAKKQGTRADLTTAQAGLKAAEAQLNSAKAAIGEAEARFTLIETQARDTEIASPIGGIIAYKSFETGEMAPAGKTIYTIYDPKDIWARVDIEETDIGRIKLDGRAIIMTAGLAGRGSEGKVIEIGREAEFATQRDVTRGRQDIKTFRVKVAIQKDEGSLKPGMTVIVRFDELVKSRHSRASGNPELRG